MRNLVIAGFCEIVRMIIYNNGICKALIKLWLLIAIMTSSQVLAENPDKTKLLNQARQLRSAGDAKQSETILIQIDDSLADNEPLIDLAVDFVAAAWGASSDGRTSEALDFFQRAIAALDRPAAANLSPKTKSLIRLTAANEFHKHGISQRAADVLVDLLRHADQLDKNRQTAIVNLGVSAGWKLIDDGNASNVENLLAGISAFDPNHAMASLGYAWSLAAQPGKRERAIKQLKEFVNRFPEHENAVNAWAMQFHCAITTGDDKTATECANEILSKWPDSNQAAEIALKIAQSELHSDNGRNSEAALDKTLWQWLGKTIDQHNQPILSAFGLWLAAMTDDENIQSDLATWDQLLVKLSESDATGQSVSDLLARLTKYDRNDDAERIASALISKAANPTSDAAPKACEAASRWAGRNRRWTLLALAAENGKLDSGENERSVAVEKLFAEALVQSGRGNAAYRWWQHLTDTRGVNDFASLLRCAETAVSSGTTEEAAVRIENAASTPELSGAQLALLDFLRSDLAIRRLDFDAARSRLERIIRSADSVDSLRGRAQWMIGETYFLQHKFPDAIESYRKVEGIDPDGNWIAPALVQAGKSFEQLGRTRDAAICYGDLISRFPQSQHATVGRDRLARIAPNENASKQSIQR